MEHEDIVTNFIVKLATKFGVDAVLTTYPAHFVTKEGVRINVEEQGKWSMKKIRIVIPVESRWVIQGMRDPYTLAGHDSTMPNVEAAYIKVLEALKRHAEATKLVEETQKRQKQWQDKQEEAHEHFNAVFADSEFKDDMADWSGHINVGTALNREAVVEFHRTNCSIKLGGLTPEQALTVLRALRHIDLPYEEEKP